MLFLQYMLVMGGSQNKRYFSTGLLCRSFKRHYFHCIGDDSVAPEVPTAVLL